MERLQGKISIVTGSSDGIGFEISRGFAEEAATVVMVSRDWDNLQSKADLLLSRGLTVLPVQGDIGITGDVKNAVQVTLEKFGRVDVLVNNAAVAIPGDITDQDDEDWNLLLNVNLLGAFRAIKSVLPSMLAQGSGSVINITSLQGDRSWDHWTTYAAAKGGLKAITRQLAGQYGPRGLRFNCISPGAMQTPMNQARREREGEEFYEMCCRLHALGRMGEANEVNGAAIFLASDESSFVTGIDLVVDGGCSVLTRS